MPRILAIDWDRHEVRGLLIASGPTGTSVAGAWAAPLTTADPAGLSGKQIGARLAATMSGQISGKVTTLVGVGRDNVQMQLLSLPPAPADELPELVRFQADRDFTALGNEASLDYIPISGDAETPNQVLAVALNSSGVSEAREVCESLGVEANRIPLRACASAALVHRAGLIDPSHIALIVNALTDEADLTVQAGDTVVLMRTVRLPDLSQGESRQRALVGEIRRTIAAVRQQLADRKVEQVIVCGTQSSFDPKGQLSRELDVPMTEFDPVAQAPSGIDSHGVPADSLSRFAAVLGMALTEADRRPPIVDFANVRRKVERRQFGRVHALAAAALVIALLSLPIQAWQKLADEANKLADTEAEIKSLQTQADKYEQITERAESVERWLATDINWLDELEEFARRVRPQPLSDTNFAVNNDVVITQVTLSRPAASGQAGGQVDLEAKAKSVAAMRELELRLRDSRHGVKPGSLKKDSTVPGYPQSLDLQIRVEPPDDEDQTQSEGPP
jgi:Tfp pilus assembly PilM family ATPase